MVQTTRPPARPSPARPVAVVEDVWRDFCALVHDAGFGLAPTPHDTCAYVLGRRRGMSRAPRTQRFADGTQLTTRELQMLDQISNGQTNDEIAATLGLALDTVKTHMRRLYRKLGARDRPNAVALAYQRGILPLDEENEAEA